jgi:hypothetical protein
MDFSAELVQTGFSPDRKLALINRNRPESSLFG